MTTPPDAEGAPLASEEVWGASSSDVRELVLDTAAEGRHTGQRAPRTSDERVAMWLRSAASAVRVRTTLASTLPATTTQGWPLSLADVDVHRRHLVTLYAAALLADVTHPQLAREGRSPGHPLRERFDAELAALTATLEQVAREAPDADPTTPGLQASGSAVTAPPSPRIRARRF